MVECPSDATRALFEDHIREIDRMLADCTDQGRRTGAVLGRFELIHAGTVAALREARSRCDRLVAIVVPRRPPGESTEASGLLRWEERLRVLEALAEIDAGAILAEDPLPILKKWRAAPCGLQWFHPEADGALDPAIAASAGIDVISIAPKPGLCTTESLLRRMQGPRDPSGAGRKNE